MRPNSVRFADNNFRKKFKGFLFRSMIGVFFVHGYYRNTVVLWLWTKFFFFFLRHVENTGERTNSCIVVLTAFFTPNSTIALYCWHTCRRGSAVETLPQSDCPFCSSRQLPPPQILRINSRVRFKTAILLTPLSFFSPISTATCHQ